MYIRFEFVEDSFKLKKKFLVMGSKDETDHITSVLESYSFVVYKDIYVGTFSFSKNTKRQYE